MYIQLSHLKVTKIRQPTPDDPGGGIGDPPSGKKGESSTFFEDNELTPRGSPDCESAGFKNIVDYCYQLLQIALKFS